MTRRQFVKAQVFAMSVWRDGRSQRLARCDVLADRILEMWWLEDGALRMTW